MPGEAFGSMRSTDLAEASLSTRSLGPPPSGAAVAMECDALRARRAARARAAEGTLKQEPNTKGVLGKNDPILARHPPIKKKDPLPRIQNQKYLKISLTNYGANPLPPEPPPPTSFLSSILRPPSQK